MIIYKSEKEIGLEALSKPVTFASKLTSAKNSFGFDFDSIYAKAKLFNAEATNKDQFDLHYLNTIMVSVGWNNNDDVFIKEECWNARNTCEDKPFNLEHDPSKIIGHITGNVVIDCDGEIISDDTEFYDVPDKFHLLTSAVIYKHISSKIPELEEAAAKLIEEIEDGEWFVSMEALFTNFDYAVTYADSRQEIIPRNSETAFLTKHLRVYGGKGVYRDAKIGRALKNITFSGKGLVREPANPESIVIPSNINKFDGVFAMEIKMAESNTVVSVNESELQQTVAELKGRLKELDQEKVEAKYNDYERTIAAQKEKFEEHEALIAELEEKLNKSEASQKESVESLQEKTKTLESVQAELDKMKAEAVKTNRVSSLVDKGVDKAEAESIVADFEGLDDAKFDKVVELQGKLVEAAKNKMMEEDDDEKKKKADKNKKAEASELEEEEEDVTPAEAGTVDGEVEDSTHAADAGSSDDEDSELNSAVASYLSDLL